MGEFFSTILRLLLQLAGLVMLLFLVFLALQYAGLIR
jgi:hypothetical protein